MFQKTFNGSEMFSSLLTQVIKCILLVVLSLIDFPTDKSLRCNSSNG